MDEAQPKTIYVVANKLPGVERNPVKTARKCLCAHCNLSRIIDSAVSLHLIQAQQSIIRYLANRLCSAEADLNMAELRLKGEWPVQDRQGGC